MKRVLSLFLILAVSLTGCSPFGQKLDGDGMVYSETVKSSSETVTTTQVSSGSTAEETVASLSETDTSSDEDNASAGSYTQITQDEAMKMMERDDGHIVLDVRRQDEYDAGHIPGALLLPNEDIGTERPAELPDTGQIILIYCRSGNRSKQAAQKLYDMGYTNIYEFGGINTWQGTIVTGTE